MYAMYKGFHHKIGNGVAAQALNTLPAAKVSTSFRLSAFRKPFHKLRSPIDLRKLKNSIREICLPSCKANARAPLFASRIWWSIVIPLRCDNAIFGIILIASQETAIDDDFT